jgi:ubiquinone/menaquinone biosynthesis C-methylase UbiE
VELNYFKVTPADWDKYDWEKIEEIRGRNRMRKVLKHIPSDGLHLDVGTGRGDGTYLVSQKKRTIGIDFGLRVLKIAAKKNGNLIQTDASNLPFKAAIFETATCLDVLEHIPNAEKAVGEIYRVLKPQGQLILQTPSSEIMHIKRIGITLSFPFYAIRGILKILFKRYSIDKKYPQPYDKPLSIRKIRSTLTSNDFVIEKEKRVNYWHPNPLIMAFSFSNLFVCTKRREEHAKSTKNFE